MWHVERHGSEEEDSPLTYKFEEVWMMLWLIAVVMTLLSPVATGEADYVADIGSPKWVLSSTAEPVETETASRLLNRAAAARDAVESFDRRLVVANWILAYQLEPMATRLLLRFPKPEDAAGAGEALALAVDQVDLAKTLWESLRDDESLTGAARGSRAERLEGLRAFAGAFSALWPVEEMTIEARSQSLRRAALDIAVVLEDDRASVAAGAQLWQAYLYAESGKLSRAIDLLPAALSQPSSKDAFALYARLLRCQYLAREHRSYAAAIALLARLEERCASWFESESDQKAARRAAALVRRGVLTDWGNDLREAGKPQRAQWCQAAIARLDEQFFPAGSPNEVLRLQHAVPLLVDESYLEDALKEKRADPQPSPSESKPKSKPDASTSGVEGVTTSGVEDVMSSGVETDSGTGG